MRWWERWRSWARRERGPSVLVVCRANVCRSPMAEHVLNALGAHRLVARSAGVSPASWRPGIDARASSALRRRGYALAARRSRAVAAADFARFDLILAVDREVLDDLAKLCPPEHRPKLRLFLDFAPGHEGQDMPDPYWGDDRGFENVLDLCEAARTGVAAALARSRGPGNPGHRIRDEAR